MRYLIFAFITLVLGVHAFTPAATAQDYARVFDEVTELNRMPALQNPKFTSFDDVMHAKLLDRKNRTVGEVQDVVMNPNGSIDSLTVEFNRLRLPQAVPINYRELVDRPSDDGYILKLEDSRLEERYPQFLSSIESASGEDASAPLNVTGLKKAGLEARDGRRLGFVKDILFSKDMSRIDAFYIEMRRGLLRGEALAIPVGMVSLEYKPSQLKPTLFVNIDTADAILDAVEELK